MYSLISNSVNKPMGHVKIENNTAKYLNLRSKNEK